MVSISVVKATVRGLGAGGTPPEKKAEAMMVVKGWTWDSWVRVSVGGREDLGVSDGFSAEVVTVAMAGYR